MEVLKVFPEDFAKALTTSFEMLKNFNVRYNNYKHKDYMSLGHHGGASSLPYSPGFSLVAQSIWQRDQLRPQRRILLVADSP